MNTLSKVHVTYVSSLITEADFSRNFDGGRGIPSMAAQKFHRLLTEGLAQDRRVASVHAVSTPPITRKATSRILHPIRRAEQRGVRYTTVPFVNMPIMRQASSALATAFMTARAQRGSNHFVICDALCGAPSIGALLAGKLSGTPVVGVLTDVPQHRPAVGNLATRMRSAAASLAARSWLPLFDAYLLLTEPMNDLVNPRGLPHLVMEGLVDANPSLEIVAPDHAYDDHGTRVLLYTGSTHKVYGLPQLIQAFMDLNPPRWELHICGQGDMDGELRGLAERHRNLVFHGVVPNRESVERQEHATLLVNPRPTEAEYTKFSFPSKNMEYMASGTPVLTTALPGMPPDYHQHVFIIQDETVQGYRRALETVTGMPIQVLAQRGASARQFVLSKKNKQAQASRLVDLLLSA